MAQAEEAVYRQHDAWLSAVAIEEIERQLQACGQRAGIDWLRLTGVRTSVWEGFGVTAEDSVKYFIVMYGDQDT